MRGICNTCGGKKCQLIGRVQKGEASLQKDKSLSARDTKKLEEIYYDPETGFTGINELARKAEINPKEVSEFLHQQDVYTLHKPIKHKFQRRKVLVHSIDEQWQADLVDMREYSKVNEGYHYLLTVIDVFSKYAWGIPLEKKTGDELVAAFHKIFQMGRKYKKLQTDKGTEFYNSKVKTLLKDNDIELFSMASDY